ncbi:MAG: hypothetical protein ACK56F_32475 [bacterium]
MAQAWGDNKVAGGEWVAPAGLQFKYLTTTFRLGFFLLTSLWS